MITNEIPLRLLYFAFNSIMDACAVYFGTKRCDSLLMYWMIWGNNWWKCSIEDVLLTTSEARAGKYISIKEDKGGNNNGSQECLCVACMLSHNNLCPKWKEQVITCHKKLKPPRDIASDTWAFSDEQWFDGSIEISELTSNSFFSLKRINSRWTRVGYLWARQSEMLIKRRLKICFFSPSFA